LDALPFKEAKVFECAHEINSTSVYKCSDSKVNLPCLKFM